MFDFFGLEKVNAKESIESMARGVTLGLLEAYEQRLEEKDREIERLQKKIEELMDKLKYGDDEDDREQREDKETY